MKPKYLLYLLILFSATSVCGQKTFADKSFYCIMDIADVTSSHIPETAGYLQNQDEQSRYWKRHKMFKALGWGTLATGFVTANAGFWWSVSMSEGNYPEKREKIAGGICYSGLFLVGASIPCFILSHICKENALLSIRGGNVTAPLPNGGTECRPAMALQISF